MDHPQSFLPVPAQNDPHMGEIREKGQITGPGSLRWNRVGVLSPNPLSHLLIGFRVMPSRSRRPGHQTGAIQAIPADMPRGPVFRSGHPLWPPPGGVPTDYMGFSAPEIAHLPRQAAGCGYKFYSFWICFPSQRLLQKRPDFPGDRHSSMGQSRWKQTADHQQKDRRPMPGGGI